MSVSCLLSSLQAARQRRRRKNEDGDEVHAEIDCIDEYIEMLYEGHDEACREKLKGTEKILKLCSFVGNLEHLVQHHTLMGALSRVLAEVSCLSLFSQHPSASLAILLQVVYANVYEKVDLSKRDTSLSKR